MSDTRQKIMDAAERLFGEQGYGATSLRQIIAEAGVNLAAIHYHFGSKEELLGEVVMRKAAPVNEARVAMLDRAEREANGAPVSVEAVLHAFLAPMAAAAERNPEFVKVMGRLIAEGLMMAIVQRHFQPAVQRLFGALRRALPHLTEEEFQWRVHFMIGAMAHTMCGPPDLTPVRASGDLGGRMDQLVAFLSGGFKAPALDREKSEVR